MVLLVLQVHKDLQALSVQRVLKVQKVTMDKMVLWVQLVLRDLQVKREMMEKKETRVKKEMMVLLVPQGLQVKKVIKGCLVPLELQEHSQLQQQLLLQLPQQQLLQPSTLYILKHQVFLEFK